MGLTGIKRGDKVIVRRMGELVGIGECVSTTKTLAVIRAHAVCRAGSFSLKTGVIRGGCYAASIATEKEIIAAEDYLRQKDDELERQEDERRKKAYDDLQEGVKLARTLCFICDCAGEKKIAEMPLDILRQAVEWLKANTTESCQP